VVEVDQELVEHAAQLAVEEDLRSLDALHLAAALLLPTEELVPVTWDRRPHAAAQARQLIHPTRQPALNSPAVAAAGRLEDPASMRHRPRDPLATAPAGAPDRRRSSR